MRLHVLRLPRLLAKRRSSAIFGLVIIGMLWAGIILKYVEDVHADMREATRTNQNFAMVFEENVLRSIGEIDKALLYLRRSIETRAPTTDFQTIANTTDVLSEIIVQVAIIDAHGTLRASNVGPQPTPPLDLSDREHYRVHLDSREDKLFISKPVVGRSSGLWSVQFTRRFLNPYGAFAGVVVASLNPNHLTQFYDKIDLGSSVSISLIGDDGVVRSSGGTAGGLRLGQDLAGTSLLRTIRAGANTTFEDAGAVDSDASLVTLRRVRGQPLWVSVSVKRSDIFKASWATLELLVPAGLVLTFIILGAMEKILQAEARARQKAKQLQLTLEHMSQGIMLVTKDLEIPIINGRCTELLQLPPELVENPPRFDQLAAFQASSGKTPAGANSDFVASESAESDAAANEIAVYERRMPNGKVIEVRSGHLPDGSFVQTFTDITKRCEAEAHVARLASEDPLTGLPNRRVFGSTLDQIIRQHRSADKTQTPADFGVLFLDLDRFKFVNDTLGHRIGDLLLQEIAKRLQNVIGTTGILARLGGDEFAVIVPAIQSRAALETVATRLADAVGEPCEITGHQIRSSVSIGIAVGPADGETADDLLMAADLALYAVKAGGRRGFQFYQSSLNKELSDRRQIEIDLREAIERNELELHYQPIIDLRRDVITGFEALARWRHPRRGMVPPTDFIAVAEDSGLILPLGTWVLKEACSRAAQWPANLNIAVNLSPTQFSAANLVDQILQILDETGLRPDRLDLEITERIFLADSEETLSILHRLKELGVRISLDDFGTGYSSLSYLRSFPFDKIKIDRSFVSDLSEGTEHIAIVHSVISIAQALAMTAIAEGIETVEQQQLLKSLGCHEGQGYLFGRPAPIEKVPDLIAESMERRLAA
jgi:diguanylate cyclase (GGDEF)-like protein